MRDLLRVELRAEESGADPLALQAAVNHRMAAALDRAHQVQGVAVETGSYAVDEEQPPNAPSRWRASQSLILTGTAADVLLKLAGTLQSDGLLMSSMAYEVSPETVRGAEEDLTSEALAGLAQRASSIADRVHLSVLRLPRPARRQRRDRGSADAALCRDGDGRTGRPARRSGHPGDGLGRSAARPAAFVRRRAMDLPDPPVLVISDRSQVRRPLTEVAASSFAGGCPLVQPARKGPAGRRAAGVAGSAGRDRPSLRRARDGTRGYGRGARGRRGRRPSARRRRPACRTGPLPGRLIGASARSAAEAARCWSWRRLRDGEPDFLTASKPGYGPALGLDGWPALSPDPAGRGAGRHRWRTLRCAAPPAPRHRGHGRNHARRGSGG